MVKKAAHATPNRLLRAARKERGWTQQQVADHIGAPLSLNVSRWENGTAFPSAYYLERLCQLFGKSVRELGLSQLESAAQGEQALPQAASLDFAIHPLFEQAVVSPPSAEQQLAVPSQIDPRVWTLPYPRNLFFLGREDVLALLQHQMRAGQAMALSQPQAISGLGGVGKTQVALEYAYRHSGDYQAVFWTRADSRDALVAGFLEIAHAVNLPERGEQDQTIMVTAVKGWLSQHTSWLLILDNADELALLPEFLPSPIRGHLLLTTRAQALGRLANRIEVETLDLDTATLLLLRRAGLLALDAPLGQAEKTDWQAAIQLSGELGGLPLALDQAGAYLEETRCSIQDYLDLYHSNRADLLRHRGGVVLDHPDSVAATWSLSFASIEQRSPLAADLLRLCSVLHPDAIPDELFLQGASHLGPALAAIETDPLAFNKALAVVQSYSLLRRTSREQTFSMHRLVQAVFTDAMTNEARDQWRERAIVVLNALFPEVRHQVWGQWERCDRLLPHALTTVAAAATQQHNLELASLLAKTADYLLQRAQYEQAEPFYQRALSIREQMLGGSHPQVAYSLHGLADLYREQGRYEQAELLYQRSLHLWEQMLGQQHPEIPSLLTSLACLYLEQGRYEQAEPLYQRALTIRQQTLGQQHPQVAYSLHGLANLYLEQGRYEQAEPLYQRALTIRQQQRGAQHPETAESLHAFARLYELRSQPDQALTLYQQALAIRAQRLGLEHPRTLDTRARYAHLLRACGRSEEAAALEAVSTFHSAQKD